MFKILFALLVLSTSCTQINSTSREHYGGHSGFRHGIIPDVGEPSMRPQETLDVKNLPQDSIERGQAQYEAHCLSCHGADGKGNGPKASELDQRPKDLSKLAKTVPQFNFYMMVSRQKGEMPGWKTIFTDQEIRDLENYLKTL